MVDLCLCGYFLSHTAFIRTTKDVWYIFYGLVLIDFLLLVLWNHIIEDATNTQICVYGKTVSIVGPWEGAEKARQAVEDLLEGRSHGYVYRKLMKDS